MTNPSLCFQRLRGGVNLPAYATVGAAGMDIAASIEAPITLLPFERLAINTGFAMQLPDGYEAQIRPRSGLALKYGITVVNSPGTIDSDYRGEVAVILINLSQSKFIITSGMRIAQMIIAPVVQLNIHDQTTLESSKRGKGGFGSTGL